jgi:hypothetical protein
MRSQFGAWAMPKRMLLLTTGALAAGLTGVVIAGQWKQAPGQPVYQVRVTPETTQLPRDEHDQIAEIIEAQLASERPQFQKRKVAASASISVKRQTQR